MCDFEPKQINQIFGKYFMMYHFILKLFSQLWQYQLDLRDHQYEKEI